MCIWFAGEYLWQQEGWMWDRLKINYSVHCNEGTCQPMQLYGSLMGVFIVFDNSSMVKRKQLYQAWAPRALLVRRISSLCCFWSFHRMFSPYDKYTVDYC